MTQPQAVWMRNLRYAAPLKPGDEVFVMGVDFIRFGMVERINAARCVMGMQHLIDVGNAKMLCVDFVLTRLPPNANLVLRAGTA